MLGFSGIGMPIGDPQIRNTARSQQTGTIVLTHQFDLGQHPFAANRGFDSREPDSRKIFPLEKVNQRLLIKVGMGADDRVAALCEPPTKCFDTLIEVAEVLIIRPAFEWKVKRNQEQSVLAATC